MDALMDNILSYLEYLNGQQCLHTTVHFSDATVTRIPERFFSRLLPYNVHMNPYCIYVKKERWDACLCAQREVLQADCPGGYCRSCHAGVREYVHPIRVGGQTEGYVSVSGYQCYQTPIPRSDRKCWEENLSGDPLPLEQCRVLIPPLCRMFELLFTYPISTDQRDEYNLILQYINERHGQISLEELGTHFGRSRSHISHLFNERCSMTLRAYCNELKLNYAKKLLTTTEVPITEIALDAGYNDVSYFIVLFKERFGQTPLQFRKQVGL